MFRREVQRLHQSVSHQDRPQWQASCEQTSSFCNSIKFTHQMRMLRTTSFYNLIVSYQYEQKSFLLVHQQVSLYKIARQLH